MLTLRSSRRPHHHQHHHHHHQTLRTFIDAKVKWVRDRGLDHAVEKEKNLRSVLALKDLIKSEPSNHLPLSLLSSHKHHLSLPSRAADFVRKYPSIFQEFLPPGAPAARPHVRLSPDALRLHDEEQSVYERDSYRLDAADRLLKLLMLTKIKKLPIKVIDQLRWDLGLPQDYVKGLVVDYPDYFEVSPMRIGGENEEVLGLEMVCWIDELGVSAMERKARKESRRYAKGMPIAFPMQFSRGFDMEKKVKRWVDEWQKLRYISPYEDGSHLNPKSDQAEKWTVAVLHEFLNLLISKKTEKDNILFLGDQLGLRTRFRRALVNHPGIFYVSNKIRTHTAVLREGYKRDLLVEKHPLMGMRYQYIHLMNKGKEQVQSSGAPSSAYARRQGTGDAKLEEEKGEFLGSEVEESGEVENGYGSNISDDDDEEEDDEDEDEKNVPNRCVVGGESREPSRIRSREFSRSPPRGNSKGSYRNRFENNLSMVSGRREPRNRRGNIVKA